MRALSIQNCSFCNQNFESQWKKTETMENWDKNIIYFDLIHISNIAFDNQIIYFIKMGLVDYAETICVKPPSRFMYLLKKMDHQKCHKVSLIKLKKVRIMNFILYGLL